MKVLIFGVKGFIGSALRRNLADYYDVYGTTRSDELGQNEFQVDLLDPEAVRTVISTVRPDVIVNCAGVIDQAQDVTLNEQYTRILLQAVVDTKVQVQQIIIDGSAAEYGIVDASELPVSEDTPLRASAGYGAAKVAEEQTALRFREEYGLPIIVLRIFNLIGTGMGKKFLVSNIKKQLHEYQAGERQQLEVNRKDSMRDYIVIDDLADAIRMLIENKPKYAAYNVGSGTSTTTEQLLQFFIDSVGLNAQDIPVVETSDKPESLVAVQADISRLKEDTGWAPSRTIANTIREIMNDDTNRH